MSLTMIIFTVNGADKLADIVPQLLGIADELVIGVDDSSTDASYDVARTFADTVVSVPHAAFSTPFWALDFILPHCNGDWVLRIDHDETLSPHWSDPRYVRDLLSNRSVTHVWIPRRWIIPPGNRYISSFPWQPDYQIRLFRNIPSLLQLSPEQHGEDVVVGEPYFVTDSWLNHWDFLWHDRATREAKVRFYASGLGDSGAEFYLYEGQAYESKPIEWSADMPELGAGAIPTSPFHASLRFVDVPDTFHAQSRKTTILAVRNDSCRIFEPGNRWSRDANVRVSYRWRADGTGVAAKEYPRTLLPHRLEPRASALMFLIVECPSEPGRYLLQPDLVEEHMAWFSDHCRIEPLEIVVQPPIHGASAENTPRRPALRQARGDVETEVTGARSASYLHSDADA